MYRIIKVLNNNAILILHEVRKKEYILLGNGIGFGKKTSDKLESIGNAKVYSLVTREKQQSVLKAVNGINPIFIEATAKIIDEAEKDFCKIDKSILLPLADHIALAVKRCKENTQLINPFNSDIRLLFSKEFEVALKGKAIIKNMTGYEISDEEAGFIALHIHAGIAGEQLSQTLNITKIINESMCIIDNHYKSIISKDSLGYSRLIGYLYYMIARVIKNEEVNIDINDYILKKYPEASKIAQQVCIYMQKQLNTNLIEDEQGSLAIHIQRALTN